MLDFHENETPFLDALTHTARTSGFNPMQIEKDYYCSVILHDHAVAFQQGLVFKGGTSLSKVHADFYRLSDDLDFVIPTESNSPRSTRRKLIAPIKEHFDGMPHRLPCFSLAEPIRGFNVSRQYIGVVVYRSLVTGHEESIKVEIGLREPVIEPPERQPARTLLTDPFRGEPAVAEIHVNVLSVRETYGEKFRAALTRREPAIRDYYDIDYAVRTGRIDVSDHRLVHIVREKLAVPGNDPVDVSAAKLRLLEQQLAGQLKPVLRAADYDQFDLAHAFDFVSVLADSL